MMNRWDERYRDERYFYGKQANVFVAASLGDLPVGQGLFLAEGEGRNAVHAASLGHTVLAIDTSREGQRKAHVLAQDQGVVIDYRVEDIVAGDWDQVSYDFAVLCFVHLPPEDAAGVHARVAACLRSGGQLILQSFARAQFGRSSGGPPRLEWLHDLSPLRAQFPGVSWQLARECEVELAEAVGHRGLAAVNEMIGTRE